MRAKAMSLIISTPSAFLSDRVLPSKVYPGAVTTPFFTFARPSGLPTMRWAKPGAPSGQSLTDFSYICRPCLSLAVMLIQYLLAESGCGTRGESDSSVESWGRIPL